jgi:hypothetical protein
MSESAFKVSEMKQELLFLAKAGKAFLEPASEQVLTNAAYALPKIKSKTTPVLWEVATEDSVVTRPNNGAHQSGSRGAANIWGKVSWAWRLTLKENDVVEVAGGASTRISFLTSENEVERELLCMVLDVGVRSGPGPTFHSQVKSVRECLFASAGSEVDVPRVPSILLTPAECVELVIAELFQEQWARKVQETHSTFTGVYKAQRDRLCTLLSSAANRVRSAHGSSALMALKEWRPQGTSFEHAD